MTALIEVESVHKHFGAIRAVDGVSFQVRRGEVLGFLGPNGAGKSTTMRMITGFLSPTSGKIRVCGNNVMEQGIAARRSLGYLPEGAPLYGDMTPLEFLQFISSVRGVTKQLGTASINRVVDQLGLGPVLAQPIDTLSKGFKRRVGLAQAVLHDADVLILDEPTDGLDPNQKREVRGLIRNLARKKAIIISTHLLEEVDAVCTRAMVINQGKIIVDCSPDELAARSRYRNAITIRASIQSEDDLGITLQNIVGVTSVELIDEEDDQERWLVFPNKGKLIVSEVTRHLQDKGWIIDELRVDSGRLDDVFQDLTVGGPH
mgnify:CR=1 FL=1